MAYFKGKYYIIDLGDILFAKKTEYIIRKEYSEEVKEAVEVRGFMIKVFTRFHGYKEFRYRKDESGRNKDYDSLCRHLGCLTLSRQQVLEGYPKCPK